MKFDSNRAWKQGSRLVAANRDLLVPIAGVFLLLPSLALTLLLPPQPQQVAGMDKAAMLLMVRDYYLSALPVLVPTLLVQVLAAAFGTIAMLTLLTDPRRPTVGDLLRGAARGALTYVGAQLILGAGFSVLVVAAALVAGVLGSAAGAIALLALAVVAAFYVWVKTSLAAPAIAAEHVRNPWTALVRSWRLTRDNSVRLALFYLLIVLVFGVIVTVTMALVGIALAVVAQPTIATLVSALISSAMGAVMSVYLVAILAVVHRQLGAPAPWAQGAPLA